MPNKNEMPTLLVCKGNDCFKKHKRPFNALVRTATEAGLTVDTVRCQGACSGPTAVVVTQEGPRWFEDLKGKQVQHDVCAFAKTASDQTTAALKPSKRLRRKELQGKQRAKAVKRLAKQR